MSIERDILFNILDFKIFAGVLFLFDELQVTMFLNFILRCKIFLLKVLRTIIF